MSDENGATQAKHTRGPWEVHHLGDEEFPGFCITPKDGPGVVCEAYFPGNGPEDRERVCADARLIAAAPDLLAALQGLMARDYEDAVTIGYEECKHHHSAIAAGFKLCREREAAARAAISKATEAKGPA